MKVRLGWLRDYTVLHESADEIGRVLMDLGLPPEDITPWGDDTVLDLEVTVNRPDCLCHLGVARELAAWFGRPFNPGWQAPDESAARIEDADVAVTIEAPDGCRRYVARIVTGIRIEPSPEWLRDRIESVGLQSINNVVDITNYVMLAYGQPLHAFDLDRLAGRQIRVRWARSGEQILALDGETYTLRSNMLVIADAERPVAIAGVIGGEEASVHPDTCNVLIESATFVPRVIRRTRRALGLQTESSYRFERGVDPELPARAADHAAHLMEIIAGGRAFAGRIDVGRSDWCPRPIRLRHSRVVVFLGTEVPASWIERRLQALTFQVRRVRETPPEWDVTPPSFRADVAEEADLLEEIARHYGYERFPATLPSTERKHQVDYPGFFMERAARRVLQGLGLHETISTSFYPETVLSVFSVNEPLRVMNPLSDRRAFLRRWIAMGLVETVQRNHQHGLTDVGLWEIGQVFWGRPQELQERRHLGMAVSGQIRPPQTWRESSRPFDFYDMKGLVETFLHAMGWQPVEFHASNYPFLHPHQQVMVRVQGTPVGFAGTFHPRWAEQYELRTSLYLAELDWDTLIRILPTAPVFRPWSRLPRIMRDIAVLVPQTVPFAAIEAVIRETALPELTTWFLIDRYAGPPVPEGFWSYTIRLIFEPEVHRASEEIDARVRRLLDALTQRVQARRR